MYDKISISSLRPPELLGVFRNPIQYYRYCVINENKIYGSEELESMLNIDLFSCPWIDCFRRMVKISKLAIKAVISLANTNLCEYREIENCDENVEFRIEMNEKVLTMMNTYHAHEEGFVINNQ